MKQGEYFTIILVLLWLWRSYDTGDWADIRIYIILIAYIYYRIPKWLRSNNDKCKCIVENGKLKYDFDLSSNPDISPKQPSTGKKAELPLQDIEDVSLYVDKVEDEGIDGTLYFYTIKIVAGKETVSYTVEEDEYDKLFNVFKEIYPMLAEKYKRNLVNYIIDANRGEKFWDPSFPLVMHDDGFKLQLLRNPYDNTSVDKFIDLKWSQVDAKLSSNNRECVFTSAKEKKLRHVISARNYVYKFCNFDYYVICDIVDDLHKEKVERLSELSYAKDQVADKENKEA